jgi:nucleotide-binding universal stress UspA family protein
MMIVLDKILVPTDFSNYSEHAMQYALALSQKFDSELHLLNVLQDLTGLSPEGGLLLSSPSFVEEFRESAERALNKITDSAPVKTLEKPVVSKIREGQPFLEIIRYARDESVDLIVMGTHGRTGLSHVLLGSVAEKVVRKAGCPVLTVRSAEHHFEMP